MNIKINRLFITFVLCLIFPFVYFYFLIYNHENIRFLPQYIYPIIIVLGLFLAIYTERKLRNKITPETKHSMFISSATCIVIYAVFLLLMTWSRYTSYVSEAIDVVFFNQVVWQMSEFKIPYIFVLNQQLYPQWSQHFSPILYLLSPFYWISHTGDMLMIVQALAAISGAIPIYLAIKHYLKSRSIGLAISFAYLSFGGLQFGFAYGFHEILFFPALFLWAYYFYLRKKTMLYLLFLVLSLSVKEEVAFIVLFWGIYLLFVRRDKIMGLVTCGLGLIWYYLCFYIIFPYFNNGKGFGYWGQYDTLLGSGLLDMIKFILFKPLTFLSTLITPSLKIEMFLQTFGQFAFLLFFFPPVIIIVLPSLMEKLLTSGIAQANGAHYSAAIAAVTVVATIETLPNIYKYNFVKKYIHDVNIFFTILIFYFAFSSNIFFGYRGYSLVPIVHTTVQETPLTSTNEQLLNLILSQVPIDATVSAQYQIAPHLNRHYKAITIWPGMSGTEDFIIIDTQFPPVLGATSKDYNDAIDKLNKNNNYQLAFSQEGINVYRRKTFKIQGLQQMQIP